MKTFDTQDFEEGYKEGKEVMKKYILRLIREAPDIDYVGEYIKKELIKLNQKKE